MKRIKLIYDYDNSLVEETNPDIKVHNQNLIQELDSIAEQYDLDLKVHYFISSHSLSPQCLYQDFRIEGNTKAKTDSILASVLDRRQLSHLSVRKDVQEKDQIQEVLYEGRS